MVGSPGIGRMAFTHIARILPGVSFPSSVVRSIIEMARFSAQTFDAFLIDRRSQRIDPLLDPDLVDRGDPAEQAAERSRTPVPRSDQLVRTLAGGRIGASGGGHGTERIHLGPCVTTVGGPCR